jgi:hypothetical protein
MWVRRLNLRRNSAGRLGYDLDAALNTMSEQPVIAIIVKRFSLVA